MGHLAIFALGPLRIEIDGKPVSTSRHKALALLVYLATSSGLQKWQKYPRETLATLLWPDYESEKAYAYLRQTLWEINSILGKSWIEADREAVGFSANASLRLDIEEFHQLLASLDKHSHPKSETCKDCINTLHTAALLYRGDFLSGFSLRDSANFDDWQFFQSESLRREYAGAMQKLARALQDEGSFDPAIDFTRRWLALDQLNEEAQRQMMELLALSGQRNAALRQYQECQRLLQNELGVIPEQ